MKDSLTIKFLYKTVLGRSLLKLLVNPRLSVVVAKYLSSPASAFIVPYFIKKNNIDMSTYDIPEGGYKSFNDFFTRPRRESDLNRDGGLMVSPCDALLTVSRITDKSVFNIKHTEYSIKSLLRDEELAKEFKGGTAFIFRLTPAHYHRYLFCTDGRVTIRRRIKGLLHSVQPVCHEKCKVFIQNSREYAVVENEELGKIVQMEVGALLVGKISNNKLNPDRKAKSGQDKGYFEYGGSSIVVLTKEPVFLTDAILSRVPIGDEIPVMAGELLIKRT